MARLGLAPFAVLVVAGVLLAGCGSGAAAGGNTDTSIASVKKDVRAAKLQRATEEGKPPGAINAGKRLGEVRDCLTRAGLAKGRTWTDQVFDPGTKVNQLDSGKAIAYVIVGPTRSATRDLTASQAGGGAGYFGEGKVYGDTGVVIEVPTSHPFSAPDVVTLRGKVVACVRQSRVRTPLGRAAMNADLHSVKACLRVSGLGHAADDPRYASSRRIQRRPVIYGGELFNFRTRNGLYTVSVAPTSRRSIELVGSGTSVGTGFLRGGRSNGNIGLVGAASTGGGPTPRFVDERSRVARCAFSPADASGPSKTFYDW